MPNFLENIFEQLKRAESRVVLREIHGGRFISVTGEEFLGQVQQAREFFRNSGILAGERCVLLAANSIKWAAAHLGLMAEGLIVVPLYSRQSPAELAGMMKDCQPRMILLGNQALSDSVAEAWSAAPHRVLLDQVFAAPAKSRLPEAAKPCPDNEIVTIIYTSGTSGEPKGVCLNAGNLTHMLSCTTERLDQLMGATREPDRVFHYLPFNFGASTILLLSCLMRESVLTLSTDLNKLADEIRLASPHYFLNVPTLLERVRRGVEEALAKRAKAVRALFERARVAWQRKNAGRAKALDGLWLALGKALIFGKIRERFGPNLRALICGSAPLAPETQQFFLMLGIQVLQAYGLTETTGICTLDDPRQPVEPGYVGRAVPGIEMRVTENEEIVVRGPNIFPGYWNRPEETARVLEGGWFHTGDQGEVNLRGNWRISGRIKNLIILNSGHNIAPEPMEDKIARLIPAAQQVVVVGNGRGYLCALLTGTVDAVTVQAALDMVNLELPHYRQIRNFKILGEPFCADSGMLTAMGKIRRDTINKRYAAEINAMYESKGAREAASGQHA